MAEAKPTANKSNLQRAYSVAQEQYAAFGVDTEKAMEKLAAVHLSLHCWQGDDVGGFEGGHEAIGGGLAVTGCYPGKPRNLDEFRSDLEQALALIPGRHRLNLHASYGDFAGRPVERDAIAPDHFRSWIDWAKARGLGLDFNPTFFAHAKAADGFTLTHPDPAVRGFWVEHGRRCREVGAAMGQALATPCITNLWIPDGYKDTPADRRGPRDRLMEALDAIFEKRFPTEHNLDAVEPKLFGIGSESYVAGSHEFYLGYAITRQKLLCLDSGHYHPTENVADKITSVLHFLPEILLHVSRGLRWDSDHVVTLTDEVYGIAREVVCNDYLGRVHLGLDYFDASINRIAAWVIGARSLLRALLAALLEPVARLRQLELARDFTGRLALQEEIKLAPVGAVWNVYCERVNVPAGDAWLEPVKQYEARVQRQRE